jgi:hypothetical protein
MRVGTSIQCQKYLSKLLNWAGELNVFILIFGYVSLENEIVDDSLCISFKNSSLFNEFMCKLGFFFLA